MCGNRLCGHTEGYLFNPQICDMITRGISQHKPWTTAGQLAYDLTRVLQIYSRAAFIARTVLIYIDFEQE